METKLNRDVAELAALQELPAGEARHFTRRGVEREMPFPTSVTECVIKKKKTKKIDEPDPSGHLLQTYITSMKTTPYGVFRYGNAAFVAINTDDTLDVAVGDCAYNGYVGRTQRKQLEATLQALSADDTVQHIVLFMHRPLEDKGSHQLAPLDGDWKSPYGKELRKFADLVTNRKGEATKYPFPKITVVFASHDHRFAAFGAMSRTAPSQDGPTYLITGGAGSQWGAGVLTGVEVNASRTTTSKRTRIGRLRRGRTCRA